MMFLSPFVGFLVVLLLSIGCAVVSKYYIILLIPIALFVFRLKILLFDFFVMIHVMQNTLFSWAWYTLVDNDLYLGAIPLSSVHEETFCKKLRIESVLSLNEDFELNGTSLAGTPIRPNDWKRLDINFMQLPCQDYYPPSLSILDRGADWLNVELSEGRKVYCHCKSGVGRSASVIAAYFIKYKQMDAATAQDELSKRRPAIFKKSSKQMQNILAYEQWLKTHNPSQTF